MSEYNGKITYDKLEMKMINEVLSYIEKLVELVDPKYAFIAIDGVAPRAKMNQQRKRRYKSYYDKLKLKVLRIN